MPLIWFVSLSLLKLFRVEKTATRVWGSTLGGSVGLQPRGDSNVQPVLRHTVIIRYMGLSQEACWHKGCWAPFRPMGLGESWESAFLTSSRWYWRCWLRGPRLRITVARQADLLPKETGSYEVSNSGPFHWNSHVDWSCLLSWIPTGHRNCGSRWPSTWTCLVLALTAVTMGESSFFFGFLQSLCPCSSDRLNSISWEDLRERVDSFLYPASFLHCLPGSPIFFSLLRHFNVFSSSLEDTWMQVCRVLKLFHPVSHIAGAAQCTWEVKEGFTEEVVSSRASRDEWVWRVNEGSRGGGSRWSGVFLISGMSNGAC